MTELNDTQLHPAVEPLAALIGTWRGEGAGYYPTIEDFTYSEQVTFRAIPGKPFLVYEQTTKNPTGAPMHTELGFLRPAGQGRAEFILAQPMGQTELAEGSLEVAEDGALRIEVGPSSVVNSETAKQVDSTRRIYELDPAGQLRTEFWMAAVGQPMQQHLHSTLTRAKEA